MESKKKVVWEWQDDRRPDGSPGTNHRLYEDGTSAYYVDYGTYGEWRDCISHPRDRELARMKMQYEPPEPEAIFHADAASGIAVSIYSDGSAKVTTPYSGLDTVTELEKKVFAELARLWRIVHERE